jgi:fructokinase
MERPALLGAVRAELSRLIGGYLDRPQLDGNLVDFLVAPELGDEAGVLGAIALARDALEASRVNGR